MQRAAVVVNPTKVPRPQQLKDRLEAVFRGYAWAPPLWIETTPEDPGAGQAREAVAAGVDLVCALGGDGTQRCVAHGLRGTDTPLGVLAAGTGNLLARNLDLPHRRYADGLRVALSGRDRRIDVCEVQVDRDGDGSWTEQQTGLVMTGMGIDGEMLGGADDRLKARVGWLAYGVSGLRYLRVDQMVASIAGDDGAFDDPQQTATVVVGNCGLLQGGLELMADAEIDDGWLDSVVLRADRLQEWASLGVHLMRGRPQDTHAVRRLRSRAVEVRADRPTMVEIDGDVVGRAYAMRVQVEPLALTIRVPRHT